MEVIVNFGGILSKGHHPLFTAQNRSFRYGDGLFESIRLQEGRVPLLSFHLQRLFEGMAFLGMQRPSEMNGEYFLEQILYTCQQWPNARVRLSVFRADGGLYAPATDRPLWLIEASALPEACYAFENRGWKVAPWTGVELSCQPLTQFKTANRLPYVLASREARRSGLDQVILFNQHGRPAEGNSSNLFLALDNELWTPPVAEGCVAGVLRRLVLEIAPSLGLKIYEQPIPPALLTQAPVAFLTNAIQGIRWVSELAGNRLAAGPAPRLVDALNEYLRFELGSNS